MIALLVEFDDTGACLVIDIVQDDDDGVVEVIQSTDADINQQRQASSSPRYLVQYEILFLRVES